MIASMIINTWSTGHLDPYFNVIVSNHPTQNSAVDTPKSVFIGDVGPDGAEAGEPNKIPNYRGILYNTGRLGPWHEGSSGVNTGFDWIQARIWDTKIVRYCIYKLTRTKGTWYNDTKWSGLVQSDNYNQKRNDWICLRHHWTTITLPALPIIIGQLLQERSFRQH